MSWELDVKIKIPSWSLDYIFPIFFWFVFPLGIFTCVGVSGCDLCLNLHPILLIL